MIAPIPDNEPERLRSLCEYNVLDTPPESQYDDITRLASGLCQTPYAAIVLIDEHRQWFKSVVGFDISETLRDFAFCAYTILSSEPFTVEDMGQDIRFSDNPFVTGEPKIRFYMGVPIILPNGARIGSLCVLDTKARRLSPEQVNSLEILSRNVTAWLELARASSRQETLVRERERALTAALQEHEQFHSFIEDLGTGVIMTDLDDIIQYANPKMADITGYKSEAMLGWHLFDEILNSAELSTARQEAFGDSGDFAFTYEIEIRHANASLRWIEVHSVPYRGDSDELFGTLITCTDVTDRVLAERAQRDSERRLHLALEAGNLGWWHLDLDSGTYNEFSDVCKSHFGLGKDAKIAFSDFQNFVHPDDRSRLDAVSERSITNRERFSCEYRVIWADGSVHWLSANGIPLIDREKNSLKYIGITQEITERKEFEASRERDLMLAQERAEHDDVTGLLNHRAFQKRFKQEAARAEREGTRMAVLMLDIDNFKFFNDVYGHTSGDIVLKQAAQTLQAVCRSYDILARFGGDEFVFLLPNIGTSSAPEIEARIHSGLVQIFYEGDDRELKIPITFSLGAALYPDGTIDRHEALRQADERMQWYKTGGTSENQAQAVRNILRSEIGGFSMLDALVTAVDNKDRYTRKHSEDVMRHSLSIARQLKLNEADQRILSIAALIHDVGKIGVPDDVLRKPGKLTTSEFEAIKQHPEMGAAIVAAVPGLADTLDAVRHHHERWDGAGYPAGLCGEETPLFARLMAVADAYSAMTTDRPYRKGMDRHVAEQILREGAGTQWDAVCVEAFLSSNEPAK